MSVVGEVIAGFGIAISTYYTKKKIQSATRRQSKVDAKESRDEDMAKAAELASIKTNLEWIIKQLGKSPNGGGIMEQMKNFMGTTTDNFTRVFEKIETIQGHQATSNLAIQRVELLQAEHYKWHEKG